MNLLDRINSPQDMKSLSTEELKQLCGDLRNEIILTVAKCGGHFASPLGAVELTVALHYIFDSPRDKLVWDVGHQAYPHKVLTGRRDRFHTIKQYGGLSGFLKREESPHDVFGAGHASTSISAALGIAQARDLKNEDYKVVSIIGDGSMSGGLAFEAMNNVGELRPDMLVVLNDNNIGIDVSVGGLSESLNRLITGEKYNRTKEEVEHFVTNKLPYGPQIVNLSHKIEEFAKGLVSQNILFEELGFRYFGPVNGHDIEALIKILHKIKNLKGPVLLHTITTKGKGYPYAEENPIKWHGPVPFKVETGDFTKKPSDLPKFTNVFADALMEEAAIHENVVAITAAMPTGTGLIKFGEEYPDRFYDVGIAEAHAVTFAGGLAAEGMHPVCAIYSTFLQRAYDQIIHDVALQNLPVIFAMDRGGLVGADGPTHHGAFDLSYLRLIPNMVVMAPKDEVELRNMVHTAVNYHDGPIAFRYPRGTGLGLEMPEQASRIPIGKGEVLREGERVAVLAVGATVQYALTAAETLAEDNIEVAVANMRFVKPLDEALLKHFIENYDYLITVEDNALMGGFGSAVLESLHNEKIDHPPVIRLGLPDMFVTHGDIPTLHRLCGIHPDNIVEQVRLLLTDKVYAIQPELVQKWPAHH